MSGRASTHSLRGSRASRPASKCVLLVVFVALALPGCPLSDRYYVDSNQGGGGDGAGIATSGAPGKGGRSGTGGGSGDGACEAETCSGECCGDHCADLTSDVDHCGGCDRACAPGRVCVSGNCTGWTSMAPPPSAFVARQKAAFAALGDKLFIFGGLDADGNTLGDGALYDPAQDRWTHVARNEDTPGPRQLASAIWTGLRVLVVGGTDAAGAIALSDGGRYDPASDAWLPSPELPVGRVAPYLANVVSAGFVMSWGGYSASGAALSGGERFSYNGDAWTAIASGPGSPVRAYEPAWASGDGGAFLFGGRVEGSSSAMGYMFYPESGQWMGLPWGGPSERYSAFSAWDGSTFFVWGGRDDAQVLRNGYSFDRNGWSTMAGSSPLGARVAPLRRSGFAFANGTKDILFIGGLDESGRLLTDGARYRGSEAGWSTIPEWTSKESHEYGVFSLVNGELLVWGGKNGNVLTLTGERYRP